MNKFTTIKFCLSQNIPGVYVYYRGGVFWTVTLGTETTRALHVCISFIDSSNHRSLIINIQHYFTSQY